jgi:hypothetical protein
MRTAFFTAILLACTIATASAHTRHHHYRHYAHQHVYRTNSMVRGLGYGLAHMLGSLSEPCRQAARMGGPCGCHAEEYFFHRSEHVVNGINLWLADEWRHAFRHVQCAAGTAAVWPGRHVAPVVSCDGGGRMTVADSWGTHEASIRGVVFVQPSL